MKHFKTYEAYKLGVNGVGSLRNSLTALKRQNINGRYVDPEILAQAIRNEYEAITGEKYEDEVQMSMDNTIADIIGHYKLDGPDFMAAWDKVVKESVNEAKGGQIMPGDYVKNQHGNIYQRVDGKVGRHDAYVRVTNGKVGKRKTGLHDSFKLTLVNKDELKENVKVGDILTKDGKKGKVVKVMDDMANVDFGNGDVYGITFGRIKGSEIVKENHSLEAKDMQVLKDAFNHLFTGTSGKFSKLEDLRRVIKYLMDTNGANESAPGYKHDCAAKVVHETYGKGTCIPEKHTLVKEGKKYVVTHYDVLFENGKTVTDIPVSELEIKTQNEHWHKNYKKKKK